MSIKKVIKYFLYIRNIQPALLFYVLTNIICFCTTINHNNGELNEVVKLNYKIILFIV